MSRFIRTRRIHLVVLACLLTLSFVNHEKDEDRLLSLYTSASGVKSGMGAQETGGVDMKYISCIIESDLLPRYRKSLGPNVCQVVNASLEVCSRGLIVAFSEAPPLIYTDDTGGVRGILRGNSIV